MGDSKSEEYGEEGSSKRFETCVEGTSTQYGYSGCQDGHVRRAITLVRHDPRPSVGRCPASLGDQRGKGSFITDRGGSQSGLISDRSVVTSCQLALRPQAFGDEDPAMSLEIRAPTASPCHHMPCIRCDTM